tara:strand:- start:2757 stop:3428 length:672 start_codon:yes stop_codon:yes gene_type:complete
MMTDVSLKYATNPFSHSEIYKRFAEPKTHQEIMAALRDEVKLVDSNPHYSRVGDPDGQVHLQKLIGRVYGNIISLKYDSEPDQFGALMFQYRESCPVIDEYVESRIKEGVEPVELEAWWNMTPARRFFGLELDHIDCVVYFDALCATGRTTEESLEYIYQRYPRYGDPDSEQGWNRPLPVEFSFAVRSLWNRQSQFLHQWNDIIDSGGTFNEFLRKHVLPSSS